VISFDQILRMARHQHDLNFVPGSAFAYSNTGYNLLAEVVQRVSGMTFREFTAGRIFRPLGMHATHFSDDHTSDRPQPRRLVPAEHGRCIPPGRQQPHRPRFQFPVHHRGGPGAMDAQLRRAGRRRRHVAARMHERGVLNDGTVIPYAFGHNIGDYRGLQAVTHTGSWAGFRTVLQRFPE
jgi:CubicO group peptidase (beta-lactamase class C family)